MLIYVSILNLDLKQFKKMYLSIDDGRTTVLCPWHDNGY